MKILVGISGGVDSAYAAYKLKNAGHEVEGAVLIMHDFTELSAAREAALSLGIPLHEIDCREPFEEIKKNFVSEYLSGRTPNPCIICNERVKFKLLHDFAIKNGFDKIATGHYARVEEIFDGDERHYLLSQAKDLRKDQTYMLYRLSEQTLSHLILPMGDEVKEELRENTPEELSFVKEKGDSQEICFIPDNDYAGYIECRLGAFPEGDFVDENGNILGRHRGIIRYTVGQRKGLQIPSLKKLYVTSIDSLNNTVSVSSEVRESTVVRLADVVLQGLLEKQRSGGELIVEDIYVKLRYQARPVQCRARIYEDNTAILYLNEPFKSVTPGESAVAYRDGSVMFGGIIISDNE